MPEEELNKLEWTELQLLVPEPTISVFVEPMHTEPEWPELEEPEESNGQDVELPPTDVEPIWKEETEPSQEDTHILPEEEPPHIEEEFT